MYGSEKSYFTFPLTYFKSQGEVLAAFRSTGNADSLGRIAASLTHRHFTNSADVLRSLKHQIDMFNHLIYLHLRVIIFVFKFRLPPFGVAAPWVAFLFADQLHFFGFAMADDHAIQGFLDDRPVSGIQARLCNDHLLVC